MNGSVHTVVDVAAVAALLADPSRARILTALADGRALPATFLASESGIAASTASEHLGRLVDGGLLVAERSGRHRYFRLASEQVAAAVEALAAIAPQQPVRSLRAATREAALRRARTCYDHLAGQLGVGVTELLLRSGALARNDGADETRRALDDPLSAPLAVHPYSLGPSAGAVFGRFGVDVDALTAAGERAAGKADAHGSLASSLTAGPSRRPLLRFCVDWSEQRHHLAGLLGATLLDRMRAAGWIRSLPAPRAVELTASGQAALAELGYPAA